MELRKNADEFEFVSKVLTDLLQMTNDNYDVYKLSPYKHRDDIYSYLSSIGIEVKNKFAHSALFSKDIKYKEELTRILAAFVYGKRGDNQVSIGSLTDFLNEFNTYPKTATILYDYLQKIKALVLEHALLCTYENKGYNAMNDALVDFMSDGIARNFSSIRFADKGHSDAINYRKRLALNVKPSEVYNLTCERMRIINPGYRFTEATMDGEIGDYLNLVTAPYQLAFLWQSISDTIKGRGKDNCEAALKRYLTGGIVGQGKLNNRAFLVKYINKDGIQELLKAEVMNNFSDISVDSLDIDTLVQCIVNLGAVEPSVKVK